MIKKNKIKNLILILSLSLSSVIVSCTNITTVTSKLTTTLDPALIAAQSQGSFTHTLKNVSVVAQTVGTGTATPNLEINLSTDTSLANYQPLTGFCGLAGTNPCVCELKWTEVNNSNSSNLSYQRTKRLTVTTVESGRVKCILPQTGAGSWDEIANATVITMNIVAVSANVTGLKVKALNYKKGTSVGAGGDFLDDTLTPFRNIHRYTCFTKRSTSHELINQYIMPPTTDPTGAAGPPATVILGSRFCSSGASVSDPGKCANPRNGFSAQSYYRNFYIRSDKIGEINSTNNTFDCAKVVESINYSAGQTIPAGQSGQYWPLDTTFSLATTFSSEWSVGVRAASVLLKAGDPNSGADLCTNEKDQSKRLTESGTVTKCMGYAKKPSLSGTCGSLKDSNGRVHPLTRLRRYRVIYPPVFKADGNVETGNTAADEVYVADRLVVDANGVPTGSMIYGPKPCNFAWFDHEGVTKRDGSADFRSGLPGDLGGRKATPGYVATSNYKYTPLSTTINISVNPDGLVFPSKDQSGSVTNANSYPSCSATLPIIDYTFGAPSSLRLVTTTRSRLDKITLGGRDIYLSEVHVQPIDPWLPNYLEDTSFQACVPLPENFVEPPLHFYKYDANTIGWCTEPYPTQNPYWYSLNSFIRPLNGSSSPTANLVNFPAAALVDGYTSHVLAGVIPAGSLDSFNSQNSGCTGTNAGTLCTMTGSLGGCTGYLAPKAATPACDRTVTYDSNQAYLKFPLQAKDSDIEDMLRVDAKQIENRNYTCQYSVHADPSKVGQKIPVSGCCGVVAGVPVLQSLISSIVPVGGHLEPFKNAASPNVRFCGSPVE